MSQKRILIIDDDPDIVFAMKVILEDRSYTVLSAPDGEEGMKLVKEESPDLIILDVMMTTKDEGFQIAYKLKNEHKYSKIPILMSTSVNKETGFKFSTETDDAWLPVDEFAEKPIHPDDLLQRVERLLAKCE